MDRSDTARPSAAGPVVDLPRLDRRDAIASVSYGFVGTTLALIASWSVSLWTDEAATVTAATRSVSELWKMVQGVDAVHGVYYLLMHYWVHFFGISPFALRLPSALVVGISAAGVYLLARLLLTRRIALFAAAVFIVIPRVTWMGIEARSFALSAALAVLMTLVMVLAFRRSAWWFAYALLSALGIAVNLYVALLLVAHAVSVVILSGWGTRLRWLAASVVGVLLASPVVVLAASERNQIGNARVGIVDLLRRVAVNQWFLGETPTGVHVKSGDPGLWAPAAIILAVVCWPLMVVAIARVRSITNTILRGRAGYGWILVPWLVLPTAIVGVYSLVASPMYNPRYFTFCIAAAAMLIGIGLAAVPWRWVRVALSAALIVAVIPIYVSQRGVYAKSGTDWASVAAYVDERKGSHDGVYFSPLSATDDEVVERTTRLIETSYPEDFRGLRDLTFLTSGADDGTLRGTSTTLEKGLARTDGLDNVWVIRRNDYPEDKRDDEAQLLLAQGFDEGASWTGPLDSVTVYSRVG
jgi:mannosyltransferase